MKTHTVLINKRTGMIEWLAPPPFKVPVKHQTKQRFSEIVPTDPIRCFAFRLLRFTFGEEGKVAAFTRRWLCIWTGRILIGPHRGEEMTSPFRQAVLDWEKEKFCEPRFPL
jgi:hypothetical protein